MGLEALPIGSGPADNGLSALFLAELLVHVCSEILGLTFLNQRGYPTE
jgi:hypothetical protein